MLSFIRELAALMAAPTISVDELAARLGPVGQDHGPLAALDLRPTDPRLTDVKLFRDAAGAPTGVDLGVRGADRPTVAQLAAAFGPYTKVWVSQPEMPPELQFFAVVSSETQSTTLLATLGEVRPDLAQAPVAHVYLRRDALGKAEVERVKHGK